jgi:hypothetical protein
MHESYSQPQFKELIDDIQDYEDLRARPKPNLFHILGQTFKERWHSAFLGWLLDPEGSHGLRGFPLQCFLEAVAGCGMNPTASSDFLLGPKDLLSVAEKEHALLNSEVFPNERQSSEIQLSAIDHGDPTIVNSAAREVEDDPDLPEDGRIDVWVHRRATGGGHIQDLRCIIEMKVKAGLSPGQATKYADALERSCRKADGKGICVFIASTADIEGLNSQVITNDSRWYCMDYQRLHDAVLARCVERLDPNLQIGFLVQHYIDNLSHVKGGTRLAIIKAERGLAANIVRKHRDALESLASYDPGQKRDEKQRVLERYRDSWDLMAKYLKMRADSLGDRLASALNDALPPLPFIERVRKRLTDVPLGDDWEIRGKGRSLAVAFRPFSEYLTKFKLPRCSSGMPYGPLLFEAKANGDDSRIELVLVFSGGRDDEWRQKGFGWCFETLGKAMNAKQQRRIDTWKFTCSASTLDEQVRACEKTIREKAQLVEIWFKTHGSEHPPRLGS